MYDVIVVGARCAGASLGHAACAAPGTESLWSIGPRSRATRCRPISSGNGERLDCKHGGCSIRCRSGGACQSERSPSTSAP